jgi:hypothetical protein
VNISKWINNINIIKSGWFWNGLWSFEAGWSARSVVPVDQPLFRRWVSRNFQCCKREKTGETLKYCSRNTPTKRIVAWINKTAIPLVQIFLNKMQGGAPQLEVGKKKHEYCGDWGYKPFWHSISDNMSVFLCVFFKQLFFCSHSHGGLWEDKPIFQRTQLHWN